MPSTENGKFITPINPSVEDLRWYIGDFLRLKLDNDEATIVNNGQGSTVLAAHFVVNEALSGAVSLTPPKEGKEGTDFLAIYHDTPNSQSTVLSPAHSILEVAPVPIVLGIISA